MKKIVASVLCGVMAISMLAGCGKDNAKAADTEAVAVETSAEATSDSAESVEQASLDDTQTSEEASTNEEANKYDISVIARTADLGDDVLMLDFTFTNNSDEEMSLYRLYDKATQNGVELDETASTGINDLRKKDEVFYLSEKTLPGETKNLRIVYKLTDLNTPVVVEGKDGMFKYYIQLADAVTETDGEVIVATPYAVESAIQADIELALLGVDKLHDDSGAFYVISTITNTTDEELDLKKIGAKAVQNGKELEKIHAGGWDVRKKLQPGESDMIISCFGTNEVGEIEFSLLDSSNMNSVIASGTYTPEELFQNSEDFNNNVFDSSVYIDRFTLLDTVVGKFVTDMKDEMSK